MKSPFKRALASVLYVTCAVASSCLPPRQASAAAPLSLSLPDALARAKADGPEVTRARYAAREADARRVGAGLVMPVNPRLAVDARPLLSGGSGSLGYGATLDFLFDVGGAPRARVREAARISELAQAELAVSRTSARVRALSGYVSAQIAELRIVEADAALVVARRVLDATQRRVNAGAGSELDAASAQVQVAELEAARMAFERDRALGQMDLRDALDLESDVPLTLTSSVMDLPQVDEVNALLQRALAAHPELKAIQARVALWSATEERLGKEVFPRIGFYAGVDSAPLSPTYGVLGLSVELPVAQRNQGLRAQSARARESAEADLALEARLLRRAVLAALGSYESSRRELERLSSQAVPAAERTLSFAEAGFQAGRFDVFRLLAAARDSLRVRASRIDAIEAAWIARIELERAVGGEVKS
ncbi:MAG TPA: TolC family protein [Polyangiaceae bacterium]|nr:TolC family protein [Polyangiaceae bacterium]